MAFGARAPALYFKHLYIPEFSMLGYYLRRGLQHRIVGGSSDDRKRPLSALQPETGVPVLDKLFQFLVLVIISAYDQLDLIG